MLPRTAATVATALPVSLLSVLTCAQESRQPIPSIASRSRIIVFDTDGAAHPGRFVRFDEQELAMLIGDEERRFTRDRIARIERSGDSLKNGAMAGAIVGGALGLLAAALQARDLPDWMASLGINIGLSTAIGAGLDAAVEGRTVVYNACPVAPVGSDPAWQWPFALTGKRTCGSSGAMAPSS